ncbi:MAG TPA: peroxiredoxin-like family protein [Thermohalobaculum sp.]|nr:peroxiredoxin-like family protein [Thermohalobaculum sp.]
MSSSEDEISRASIEAHALDRQLQDRLDLLSAQPGPGQLIYDRLVARLTKAGAGAQAPEIGGQIPDFILPDDRGRLVGLDELLTDGPLVLSLNRGHWCGYCKLELRNLAAICPAVEQLGARIVSIIPEKQRYAAQLKAENGLDFSVLTDLDNAYALSLGLMIWVGSEGKSRYQTLGLDLSRFQGNDGWFLPIPATFVIGPGRVIAARFVEADFRRRMASEAILDALETLAAKR